MVISYIISTFIIGNSSTRKATTSTTYIYVFIYCLYSVFISEVKDIYVLWSNNMVTYALCKFLQA